MQRNHFQQQVQNVGIKHLTMIMNMPTSIRYLERICTVPNTPKMTATIWRKLARMGAHWYPKKSNTCLCNAATCEQTKSRLNAQSSNYYACICVHKKLEPIQIISSIACPTSLQTSQWAILGLFRQIWDWQNKLVLQTPKLHWQENGTQNLVLLATIFGRNSLAASIQETAQCTDYTLTTENSSEKDHQPQGICTRKIQYTVMSIIDKVLKVLCLFAYAFIKYFGDLMMEWVYRLCLALVVG